jgi:hypothetical protein
MAPEQLYEAVNDLHDDLWEMPPRRGFLSTDDQLGFLAAQLGKISHVMTTPDNAACVGAAIIS